MICQGREQISMQNLHAIGQSREDEDRNHVVVDVVLKKKQIHLICKHDKRKQS